MAKKRILTSMANNEFSKRYHHKIHFDCIREHRLLNFSTPQIFACHEKHHVIWLVHEVKYVVHQHLEWLNLIQVCHQLNANFVV